MAEAVGGGVVHHGVLAEQHVVFHLVAGDGGADLLHGPAQQRDGKVGDADGAGQALLLDTHQVGQGVRQVHARGRASG